MSAIPSFAHLLSQLKASPRLAGVSVQLGRKFLAAAGAPRRVVLVPTDGQFGRVPDGSETTVPVFGGDNTYNLAECPLTLEAHCWGADHDAAWDVFSSLTNAMNDYRLTFEVEVIRGALSFSQDADTSSQGEEITATWTWRLFVVSAPIPGPTSTGEIDAVRITDVPGNIAAPLLPLP